MHGRLLLESVKILYCRLVIKTKSVFTIYQIISLLKFRKQIVFQKSKFISKQIAYNSSFSNFITKENNFKCNVDFQLNMYYIKIILYNLWYQILRMPNLKFKSWNQCTDQKYSMVLPNFLRRKRKRLVYVWKCKQSKNLITYSKTNKNLNALDGMQLI